MSPFLFNRSLDVISFRKISLTVLSLDVLSLEPVEPVLSNPSPCHIDALVSLFSDNTLKIAIFVVAVQSLSCVQLFSTPWTAASGFPVLHYLAVFAQIHVH